MFICVIRIEAGDRHALEFIWALAFFPKFFSPAQANDKFPPRLCLVMGPIGPPRDSHHPAATTIAPRRARLWS